MPQKQTTVPEGVVDEAFLGQLQKKEADYLIPSIARKQWKMKSEEPAKRNITGKDVEEIVSSLLKLSRCDNKKAKRKVVKKCLQNKQKNFFFYNFF